MNTLSIWNPIHEMDELFHGRLASVLGCALLLAGEATDQASGGLAGSPLVCLGAQGGVMRQRLRQCLAGQLDT